MHKLIYLLIPLTLGFFSCTRKVTEYTPKLTYELPCDTLDVAEIFEPIDTSKVLYGSGITIDTGDTNRIRYYNTMFTVPEPKLDTSDVIVKYVCDWQEGEIETLTAKCIYPISQFGVWLGATGKDSKLYKVKDGVWIPVEWPKDIVNVYIRPKK